jgi:hypothetical protein
VPSRIQVYCFEKDENIPLVALAHGCNTVNAERYRAVIFDCLVNLVPQESSFNATWRRRILLREENQKKVVGQQSF